MAFGANYHAEELPEFETLENGTYKARIVKAEIKEYKTGNQYAFITVQISGHPRCNPNTIIINEAPQLGQVKANGQPVTEEDVKRGNGQITRFFKSFGIKDGDFDLRHWTGAIGTVKCSEQYDKNEPDHKSKQYKQLTPTVVKDDKASTPAPVEAVKQAFNGMIDFKEDIPF